MPSKPAAAVGLSLLLCCGLPGHAAGAGPCEELRPWSEARRDRPGNDAKVSDWAAQEKKEWEALEKAASETFESYLAGRLQPGALATCLQGDPDRELFETVLPSVFYSRSLAELAGPQSPPELKALAAAVGRENSRGQGLFFRLGGHSIPRPQGAPPLGGFHRGSGSLFMDFELIPRQEWLLVFSHELIHSLDQRLRASISIYNRDASEIIENTDPALLRRWLLAGLDRGFLAEARAWTLTARLYSEGLKTGIWPALPWMDEVLKSCGVNRPGMPELLGYLDPRFEDPREGVFLLPQVSGELEMLRQGIRRLAAEHCLAPDPDGVCELGFRELMPPFL